MTTNDWRGRLDGRELAEIAFAEHYAQKPHGTDGHSRLLLIARLATMLDAARGADELQGVINQITGMPDYAVQFSVWSWPDGGFMAGVVVTSASFIQSSDSMAAFLPPVERVEWDEIDGFKNGMNAHGSTFAEAIIKLYQKLDEAAPKA